MKRYIVKRIPREMIHCPFHVGDLVILIDTLQNGYVYLERYDGIKWVLHKSDLRRA